MIQEPFAYGNSLIHRLDPRVRVIFATLYSFLVAISSKFSCLFAALFLSILLITLAQLDLKEVVKRLVPVNILILLFWLILPVTFKGEALFSLGPFNVSREGLLLCSRITVKSNTILMALMSLISSMSIATLGHALGRLGVPPKMVLLLLMTYRYIFVIEEEFERLARAAKIRGFRPKTNLHTYRTYAYFIGMLFVRASARAERVHQAMLCRGFEGRFHSLRTYTTSRLDWAWSMVMSILMIGLGALEWSIGLF